MEIKPCELTMSSSYCIRGTRIITDTMTVLQSEMPKDTPVCKHIGLLGPCSERGHLPWGTVGISIGGCQRESMMGFRLWLGDLGWV
jgi:hypothetical protein